MNNASFFGSTGSFFGTIACLYYFFVPLHGATWVMRTETTVVSCIILSGSFISIFWNKKTSLLRSVILGISLGLLTVSFFEHRHNAPNPNAGAPVSLTAIVTTIRASYPGQTVRMRACKNTSCTKKSHYFIEMKHYTDTRLEIGDITTIKGTTSKIEAFETENGTLFDYPRYLWKDAIAYRVNGKDVEITGTTTSVFLKFKKYLQASHQTLVQTIKQTVSWKSSPILSGILIGDGTLLSDETNDRFRRLGLSHILVLSGSNMVIIASVLYLIFRRTSLAIRSYGTILSLVVFLFLAGIAPPALRAVVMVSLFLIIKNTGRIGNESRVLVIAGLFMTLLNPRILLYDVSFQLSFIATAGLIYISPLILSVLPKLLPLRGVLAETLGAQIAVTPIILMLSASFSPYSLPLNMIVVPVVPLIMLFGGIGMLTLPIAPSIAIAASWPADFLIKAMLRLAEFADTLPRSTIMIGAPSAITTDIIYIALCAFLAILWRYHKKADKVEDNGTLFA